MLGRLAPGVSFKRFAIDLKNEIADDNVTNGAAALGYYFFLAIFPAMIALLSVLPFFQKLAGISNLDQVILGQLQQALPGDAWRMFAKTITEITSQPRGGLLSIGLLATLWAASNGMYATMQQLNITYDVKEGRPFWKVRGVAIGLTVAFGLLTVLAFGLIVGGGHIENLIGGGAAVTALFTVARWVIIAGAILLGFALVYKFGPDVEQKFKFITPGSAIGTVLMAAASVGIKVYVDHFGKYNATYGSLGAVIVFMLWLNVLGLVVLVGSEINALIEHYSPDGKAKGEKKEPIAA